MLTTILALLLFTPPRTTLDIYFVDVEGGAATLIVTPAGESLLIDSGWPRPDARDPKRIQAAMKDAGVTRIDHLLITHYHRDHWGGVAELAKLVPVSHWYNHGPADALADDPSNFPALNAAYDAATGGKAQTLKFGDTIPLKGVPVSVLSSNRETAYAIGNPNPACRDAKLIAPDPTDNAHSVGVLLTFGKFRFLDLGDLTWNVEQKLVCPVDGIGPVNLYQVTHHGAAISNNSALLATVHPQAAIENNGPAKGGEADTYKRLRAVPNMEIFQLHRNLSTTDADNTAPEKTANLGKEEGCAGNLMKVSVAQGGTSFKVFNARTGQSWDFQTRP
jgi:beta-lactamase superfamily II metal-dependent hydrolase